MFSHTLKCILYLNVAPSCGVTLHWRVVWIWGVTLHNFKCALTPKPSGSLAATCVWCYVTPVYLHFTVYTRWIISHDRAVLWSYRSYFPGFLRHRHTGSALRQELLSRINKVKQFWKELICAVVLFMLKTLKSLSPFGYFGLSSAF